MKNKIKSLKITLANNEQELFEIKKKIQNTDHPEAKARLTRVKKFLEGNSFGLRTALQLFDTIA